MVIMANIPSLERKLIKSELKQRSEEGCDIHEISERVTTALLRRDNNEELHQLYEELMALPIDKGFPYVEPSTLEEIKSRET